MALLEVNNLSIQFGGLKAVDNFNLKIKYLKSADLCVTLVFARH